MNLSNRLVPRWLVASLGLASATLGATTLASVPASPTPPLSSRRTLVSIVGEDFYINGQPAYAGRSWQGRRIEGLLLNSRMVQGIFDDRNPATVQRWAYPDTGHWDVERNTREFLTAMPAWRQHGLLAFTINLQGGSPEGYSGAQPWHNSAIEADGSLRTDAMARLARILDKADDLGMVVILGYFYFGQDERLRDEQAVLRAIDNATQWLLTRDYRNVLVEINNECDVGYNHLILRPERVHELILRVRNTTQGHRRLYVGTSYGGGTVARENVVRVSDFLLMHGNGVSDPERIRQMVREARSVPGYFPKPILFNEDDHFDFHKPSNNFLAAVGEHASWGFFDPGKNNYNDGYQSPPVQWTINTPRKTAFFGLLAEMTGSQPDLPPPAKPSLTATAKTKPGPSSRQAPGVRGASYHGWANALIANNGIIEVVVVPSIGRIMQFGFAGEEGVFWENRALDGQSPNPAAKEWINFGGDKTWPAPEADWSKHTGQKGWLPPPAFDAMPLEASFKGGDILLTSPLDPFYGIRTLRRIHLDPKKPVLTICTTYERVSGSPSKIAVWVITQLKHPAGVYVPLTADTIFSQRYWLLGETPPPSLKIDTGLISMARNPKGAHKIGSDASSLLWVGPACALRIDSWRLPNREYPDHGCSAEVYTSPDPLPYVELETLGPLHLLKTGDRVEQVNTYTLIRRTELDPEAEARRILGR